MFVRAHCLLTTALCVAGVLASAAALAADIKPAVIYDLGGKFDKSFNEGVFNGATRFKKETGVDFRDLDGKTIEQNLQTPAHDSQGIAARQGFVDESKKFNELLDAVEADLAARGQEPRRTAEIGDAIAARVTCST